MRGGPPSAQRIIASAVRCPFEFHFLVNDNLWVSLMVCSQRCGQWNSQIGSRVQNYQFLRGPFHLAPNPLRLKFNRMIPNDPDWCVFRNGAPRVNCVALLHKWDPEIMAVLAARRPFVYFAVCARRGRECLRTIRYSGILKWKMVAG